MEKYKTAWISDLHLSTFGSKTDDILYFLNNYEVETLYIVGDFIDIWRIRVADYWPDEHTKVFGKIIEKASLGTKIIYLPGNHDEFLSEFEGQFGNFKILKKTHYQIGKRKFIVMHGHQFDGTLIKILKPLIILGTFGFDIICGFSKWYNNLRIKLGKEPFSLSAYLRSGTKNISNDISNYNDTIIKYLKIKKVDGIIYGHLHKPIIYRAKEDKLLINMGDFVEHCSFLLEDYNNNLYLMKITNGQPEIVDTLPSD